MSILTRANGRLAPSAMPPDDSLAILVVDGDATTRRHLDAALTRCGHGVFTAANLPDAVGVFRRQGDLIDVALVGVRTLDDSGPEVLKALRYLDPDLPVVFMSGDLDCDLTDPLADALWSEGADGLIAKPFRPDDLGAVLRDAARRLVLRPGRAADGGARLGVDRPLPRRQRAFPPSEWPEPGARMA